jgi:hypothetical protein
MPKLYRPPIPLAVKCQVAERQILKRSMTVSFVGVPEKPLYRRLKFLLAMLAALLGCEVEELRLDHDPPLAARQRKGYPTIRYIPDANDAEHLFYRPHGPEHEGSHLIKTNVRGDHGQHPDRVLIKKNRRIEASRNGETRRKATGFPKRPSQVKRATDSAAKLRRPKPKWAKRPFPKRRKER